MALQIRKAFVGPNGVRAGWRFLGFLVLLVAFGATIGSISDRLFPVSEKDGWTPYVILIVETLGGLGLVLTLVVTAVVGRLERRGLRAYGLDPRQAFASLFWQGTLWGFVAVATLVLLIALAGGASIHGLALSGGEWIVAALFWGLAMTALGLAEEFLFRGYSLTTLAGGMGFWPASVLLSLLFGALHYFGKPMETWVDGVSVTLIALFFCFTLRRTGSLWFAIGFHAAFDYAALAVFAAPNCGNHGRPVSDHLLDVRYRGADWLTGGPCGVEASVFVFIVIAALFVLFDRRFRHPG